MIKKTFLPALIILYLLYLVFFVFFQNEINTVLRSNMPFREFYYPTLIGFLYVNIFPIISGYFFSKIFYNEKNKYFFYVNLSLVFSLFAYLPFLLFRESTDWFRYLTNSYILIWFPCLFLTGALPFIIKSLQREELSPTNYEGLQFIDAITGIALGTIIFVLNLVPAAVSRYLVGADIYYHAGLSRKISEGSSIFMNPYFKEGSNYYYSFLYYLLSYINKLTSISLDKIWMLYTPFCAFIFIYFMYMFFKRYHGNVQAAVISTLLIFPTRQILWSDPAARDLSYAVFAVFLFLFQNYLLGKSVSNLLLLIISFFLVIFSHPEIALHAVLIVIVYLLLTKVKFIYLLLEKVVGRIKNLVKSKQKTFFVNLNYQKNFYYLAIITLSLLAAGVFYLTLNFSVSNILIFNDIPLSLFQPIGIISLWAFLFTIPGAYFAFIRKSKEDFLLLAVFSLGGITIFYFTHIWVLFHRYFTETAYIAVAAFAGGYLSKMLVGMNYRCRKLVVVIFSLFLIVTLWPKYLFISSYAKSTNDNLAFRQNDFNLINAKTISNTVIVINPNDLLNRYLPFYTGRYIFAGSSYFTKEQQWQVLPFCNGIYLDMCDKRFELSKIFFDSPTKENLDSIRKVYEVDYLLLSKNPNEYKRFNIEELNLALIAENDHYLLYIINK